MENNNIFRTVIMSSITSQDLQMLNQNIRNYFIHSLIVELTILLICTISLGLAIVAKIREIRYCQLLNQDQKDCEVKEIVSKQKSIDELILMLDKKNNPQTYKQPEKNKQIQQSSQKLEKSQKIQQFKHKKNGGKEKSSIAVVNKKLLNHMEVQLSSFQPFLLGFVLCNNILLANSLTSSILAIQIVLFLLFNLLKIANKYLIFKVLFVLPALCSFAYPVLRYFGLGIAV